VAARHARRVTQFATGITDLTLGRTPRLLKGAARPHRHGVRPAAGSRRPRPPR